MAIRDKMAKKVAPHLEPGETIHAVFGTQTRSAWLMALFGLPFILSNRYIAVAVTDRRIILGKPSAWSATSFAAVEASLPRATRIGPPEGALWFTTESLGRKLRIHRRWHEDIRTADSHLGAEPSPLAAPDTM
jgi:hypothetical protein